MPEALRDLLEAIRRDRNLNSQRQVADLCGLSAAQVSGLSTGERRLTEATHSRLVEAFPDFRGQLDAALRRAELADRDVDERTMQKIEALVDQGRHSEATDSLRGFVRRTDLASSIRLRALRRLAPYELDEGNIDHGIGHAEEAASIARHLRDPAQASAIIERLGAQLTRLEHYELASAAVTRTLALDISDTDLWRRRGIVHWYAGDLATAFADLTTALHLGHRRRHILHARGQVLAEMGATAQAIADLTEVLDDPATPMSGAYARSSRALAIGLDGGMRDALEEFGVAEAVTPRNAWLQFFKGRCYDEVAHDASRALECFRRSIELDGPRLTAAKRLHARERIAVLEQQHA